MKSDKERIYYELLALRCRRGEPEAFEELIRHWEGRLFYYLRRLLRREEDAWDALQETWLKAIRGIKRLRDPVGLPTWLYRIARNTAMSHLRKTYAERRHLEEDSRPEDMAESIEEVEFENAERVHYGLGQISLRHREVLVLHFLEEMSLEEIGDVLEIPSGTVKSRLHYAKRALRLVLEEEDETCL